MHAAQSWSLLIQFNSPDKVGVEVGNFANVVWCVLLNTHFGNGLLTCIMEPKLAYKRSAREHLAEPALESILLSSPSILLSTRRRNDNKTRGSRVLFYLLVRRIRRIKRFLLKRSTRSRGKNFPQNWAWVALFLLEPNKEIMKLRLTTHFLEIFLIGFLSAGNWSYCVWKLRIIRILDHRRVIGKK